MKKLLLLTLINFSLSTINAQEANYNIPQFAPQHFNPALAGEFYLTQFNANIQRSNIWTANHHYFDLSSYILDINSSIGGYYKSSHFDGVTNTEFALTYAYPLRLTKRLNIIAAASPKIISRKCNLYWTNADSSFCNDYSTLTPDLNTGLLIEYHRLFFGFSVRNFHRQSMLTYISNIGYRLSLFEKEKLNITPSIVYQRQGGFQSLASYLEINYKFIELFGGVNNDQIITGIGIQADDFTFRYNLGIVQSSLTNADYRNHQFTIRYSRKHIPAHRVISFPDF